MRERGADNINHNAKLTNRIIVELNRKKATYVYSECLKEQVERDLKEMGIEVEFTAMERDEYRTQYYLIRRKVK